MKRILCPVDYSEDSDYAVWYAHELSKQFGGELHCLHVLDPVAMGSQVEGAYASAGVTEAALERIEEHAKEELGKRVKRYEMQGVHVEGHHRSGRPADEIVAAAGELEADLIVIATHGRTGFDKLVFGSTCERVVRQSKIPVLSVKLPKHLGITEKHEEPLRIERILYPVDFSDNGMRGLPEAKRLCSLTGATLILGHVIDNRRDYPLMDMGPIAAASGENLQTARDRLKSLEADIEGIETESWVYMGQPHRSLLAMIDEENIDFVVMPTHGYKGLSHLLLGSVAERLVRFAPCPVLTTRPAHTSTHDPANQNLEEAQL